MCLKSWSSNYEQLLLEARLPTLKVRRSELSLIKDYRQAHTLSRTSNNSKTPYRNRGINANTAYHMQLLLHINSPSIQKHSECVWNSLPEGVTSCTSISGFECHLKQSNQLVYIFPFKSHLFYMYTASIDMYLNSLYYSYFVCAYCAVNKKKKQY